MWLVGSFDPVLELVIFGRQKLGDLIISSSYVTKRRPCISRSANLKLMAAHVVFLTSRNPQRGFRLTRLGPKARQREAGESPFVVPPRGKSEHAPLQRLHRDWRLTLQALGNSRALTCFSGELPRTNAIRGENRGLNSNGRYFDPLPKVREGCADWT